jgi:uncharacterized protein YjdB
VLHASPVQQRGAGAHALRRSFAALVAAITWSCGGSITGVDGSGSEVATVTVAPSTFTLTLGGEAPIQATVRDGSDRILPDVPVLWSVKDSSIAHVSPTGVVTGRGVGSTQVAASAGGVSALAAVTVQPPPVASVLVQPLTQSLVVGQSATFTATPRDVNGAALGDRVVSWSSSSEAVATVSQTGEVTARGAGMATITATSEGKWGSSTVTVDAPAAPPVPVTSEVASVVVLPSAATVQVGGTTTLTATINDATGAAVTDRAVNWASNNVAVATVSASGVVTGQAAGTAVISATSDGRSGSATVTVVPVPVGSVTISPSSAALVPTQVLSLSVEVRDENKAVVTDRAITFTSSNPAVATVSTTGAVTAVTPGSTTITATSEGRTGTAAISVVPMPVGSVNVSPATANVIAGQAITLSATVRDTSGAVVADRVVTWQSSNSSVATVSSAGVVTGKVAGTVTITATSETRSGSAAVTVQPVPVATVTLAPKSVTLEPGRTATLVATTKSAAGTVLTGRAVTFSSDNAGVARVSSDGVVTAVGPGAATITASSEGKTATATVTVRPSVARVVVSPGETYLRRGGTVQLSATAYDSSDHVIIGRAVTWTTSDDHVAKVSDTGLVTARRSGTVTITATIDGRSGSAKVRITN